MIAPKPLHPDRWKLAATRLYRAVRRLGAVKDGKTLFEHSPSKDDATLTAWLELNNAQAEVADLIERDLASLKADILADPEDDPAAGSEPHPKEP